MLGPEPKNLAGSPGSQNTAIFRQRLKEKETEVAMLQEQVNSLSAQLQAALSTNSSIGAGVINGNGSSSAKKRRHIPLSPHAMNVREVSTGHLPGANGGKLIMAQRERLGRNASIATQRVLEALERRADAQSVPPPIQRILDMFQHPLQHMEYLNSDTFAKDLYKVTTRVRVLFEREPRVVFLPSPCYVFGDIHGNLEDLHFFSDNLWRLGMSLTAGNFLFLGDYVDRGLQCLECLAYLFALKLQNPSKVFLLRGNHETRDVNGWEEHYAQRSFIYQCRSRFGDDIGYRLWEVCNQAFDRIPLAAVIDNDIFCVHGGIPRPVNPIVGGTTRIQDILTVPKVAGINPPYEHEDEKYQQVASDCIWSDPASEEQEMTTVDPLTGYGESLRGGGAICFGHRAVTQFLQSLDYSYIMRAHEAHAEGVAVAKEARVFTVFSTSQDHNQGSHAMAGCILVDNTKLQVINRSPAYKNQYVHRRDSVSLAHVSESEIQKRIQLGLVTATPDSAETDDEVLEEEVWQDFDDTSSEEETARSSTARGDKESTSGNAVSTLEVDISGDYVLSNTRRSSVDLSTMNLPPEHDAAAIVQQWDQQQQNSFSNSSLFDQHAKRTKGAQMAPGFAPIQEAAGTLNDDDEEIDTVDGGESDDVME